MVGRRDGGKGREEEGGHHEEERTRKHPNHGLRQTGGSGESTGSSETSGSDEGLALTRTHAKRLLVGVGVHPWSEEERRLNGLIPLILSYVLVYRPIHANVRARRGFLPSLPPPLAPSLPPLPFANPSIVSPIIREAVPQVSSTTSSPRNTSPLASAKVLP